MNKSGRLAGFLREKRVAVNLTQSEVARKLGYSSPQFVSNWERGLANPPVFVLKEITKMYKVSADTMFNLLVEDVKNDLQREFYAKGSKRK